MFPPADDGYLGTGEAVVNADEDALETMRVRFVVSAVLVVITVGGAVDLYFDAPKNWLTPHVLTEVTLMSVSAGVAIYLWREWSRAVAWLAGARASVFAREAERDAWRQRAEAALDGLGRAIDDQFTAWGLTPSEREVALFLLKGHDTKRSRLSLIAASARCGSMLSRCTKNPVLPDAPNLLRSFLRG